ncbi:light-harvesting protein B-800-850 alpha chain [Rhodobacter aestuarii]|uniref:Antenna pigment protein alpha chain n=1 Tax=Rhodobacter aestuarii TaxID=453582 RepID=A0A1N7IUU3_9RHOB|nr:MULTISPECIES: light-harvesting protein [Rhodobacter]PTV97505.1 light-harvesting protein B-800-850 alpha chain [Rhodobacter aestuarii]SIS40862.1 light-harvesting protein B-800-850 alpha chain [Rhodobacter aestuarii]SOC05458.1 light-harvesting protein B-800-850 alpha chain [Rhodobacter sp. JA431]
MNNAKVWTVVAPSTGVPLVLGAVAVTALIVHGGLLATTDWFGAYWNGQPMTAPTVVVAAPAQ